MGKAANPSSNSVPKENINKMNCALLSFHCRFLTFSENKGISDTSNPAIMIVTKQSK